jgi:aryl-phospho-beta-D-glucosidase BglC (GH1 family)
MRKLISKVAPKHSPPSKQSSEPQPNIISPPTPLDVIRYRFHHGTNLGSIFVLEKWLTPSMFPSSSPSGSELSAVTTSLSVSGLAATREKWTQQWRGALSDADLRWLVEEAHVTSIRLPIGYFTLGERFCQGTPFDRVKEVYRDAWSEVRELVTRARGYGIGVLLDLHALPGGANGDEHSGSGSGKAELWGHKGNLERAAEACVFVAGASREMDGVVGIQIVNEACWGAKGMYDWYDEVIRRIAEVDSSMPVYISDAWDLERCLKWVNGRKIFGNIPSNPVVVDTHQYYTFSEGDRSQSPQEIIARIPGELSQLNGKEGSLGSRGEAQVIIGEWSCVLDGQTWGRVRPEEQEGITRQFGQAQSRKWQEKAGGSYFWTMKMDWMDGGGWGFVEQTKKGNISPPPALTLRVQDVKDRAQAAQDRRGELAQAARRSHNDYWTRTCPGKRFEHHLYGEGWDVGFSDALTFFIMRANGALGVQAAAGGDKIGCLEIWVKKRLLECGQRGEFVWEWEQGFRSGVEAFYKSVGI